MIPRKQPENLELLFVARQGLALRSDKPNKAVVFKWGVHVLLGVRKGAPRGPRAF